jgi:glycosyltransferase involved in cell wall biosynthesis
LKKLLNEYKPDLVHFHAPNPLVMLYLLMLLPNSCKLIVHWHSDIVEQKMLYVFVRPLERKILKRADKIFITSPNYLGGSAPLQPVKDKVQIVASAIEPERFTIKPDEMERYLEIKAKYEGRKIIFFVGRHVPYKGLKYLLQAETFIKNDCLIIIAGSGPLTVSLKNEFDSDRIRFLGILSDLDLKLYLNLADIFAFPSITKNEAFGLVLAEAMYCKTPAVTFTITDLV